jgi:hypothetical protein
MDALIGKTFLANVKIDSARVRSEIGTTTENERGVIGSAYLNAQADSPALVLHFEYIEHNESRIHYHITAAPGSPYSRQRLTASRNGWLYFTHTRPPGFWKIDIADRETIDEYFTFTLRDHRGYRVANVPFLALDRAAPKVRRKRFPRIPYSLLSTEEGAEIQFRADIISVE